MKGIYTVDKFGRITLGKPFVGKAFSMTLHKNGAIYLIPGRFIPDHEAWLYENKEALASVKRGLAQAASGKGEPLSFNLQDDETWLSENKENENAVSAHIPTRSNGKARTASKKRTTKSKRIAKK